jgi:thioredoxin reductase (NADPH)
LNHRDVIIIGGGPGGMSALLWCNSLGISAVLLERSNELGGQMLSMYHHLIDYPGVTNADGRELRDRFVAQLDELKLDYQLDCEIKSLDLTRMKVDLDNEEFGARAIILATGARKRRLGVPGEARLINHGVSFSATGEHQLFAGREVIVVGGGDSAVENSLILARVCPRVTLIHHSDSFRARPEWLAEARANAQITFITGHAVKEIIGEDRLSGVIIEDLHTGGRRQIDAEGVFIRIGMIPNTEFLQGMIELDDAGYISVDRSQRTSLPMVYAVGDVTRPVSLSIATAVGHGANAAKDIAQHLKTHR